MTSLTPVDTCRADALNGIGPVPADVLDLSQAIGQVLAADLRLPLDLPPGPEALCAGFAVAALDLVGASAGNPVPLARPVRVCPGDRLAPGTDAVLPEDGTDSAAGLTAAICSVAPGDGVRHMGHDGRRGALVLRAGQRLAARHLLLAEMAGVDSLPVRRPRVRVMLENPRHVGFVQDWLRALGAEITADAPHLTLRVTTDHRPRLALCPAETAWLQRDDTGLVLTVPTRFDGMLTAILALGLPAMTALTGASPCPELRPLTRKVVSAVGLSEMVLLAEDGGGWVAHPAGTVTVASLAASRAFAVLPPESEGLPAGALLAALSIDAPFG